MKKISKVLLSATMMFTIAACGNKNSNNGLNDKPLTFEEEYLTRGTSYAEGGKFALSVISSIGSICAGVGFDSPTAIVSGCFSLLTSINDQFNGNKGPTIVNVMNKLNEMDQKLDQLDEKLDKNYTLLADEIVRTQAKVDEVLLEEQDQAIKAFNTNYVEKINDFQRDFADYIEQSLKTFVNENQVADIYLEEVKNQWSLVPLVEINQTKNKNIKFEIKEFPKAKELLEENYNVVVTGFMDKLSEDIDANMEGVVLPTNLDQKDVRDMVIANTIEKFTRDYYVNNHQKALDIRNLAINYSKQINNKATKSIVDTYINRMKYMFNFAGEIKEYTYGALANIEHALDVNNALAAQACLFAGVNQEEIRNEFLSAREIITNRYEAIKELPDNYCYLTNTKLGSGFYRANYDVNYTNPGNTPKFTAKFALKKVGVNTKGFTFEDDDPYKHSYLTEVDHMRIKTRMNLMMINGVLPQVSYIDYLRNAKIINAQDYGTYERLVDCKWISTDALRFFTGLNVRDMNDKDRNLKMECVKKGNPDGDYFDIGWKGNYKGAHDTDCWKGQIAETTFIDANTGETMEEKKVCAYATYNESHWYWTNDEHCAFVDNAAGNYFFILENVA